MLAAAVVVDFVVRECLHEDLGVAVPEWALHIGESVGVSRHPESPQLVLLWLALFGPDLSVLEDEDGATHRAGQLFTLFGRERSAPDDLCHYFSSVRKVLSITAAIDWVQDSITKT